MEPIRICAEPGVQGPVLVEQHPPDQDHRGDGHQHGAEEGRAELAFHGERPFQPEGQLQRQQHRQRHRDRQQNAGILCSKQESLVFQQGLEIVQPDKFSVDRTIHQTVVDHHPKGQHKEQQHPQQAGEEEQERVRLVPKSLEKSTSFGKMEPRHYPISDHFYPRSAR